MVVLLGSTGYLGQAFARELRRRRIAFVPLTRQAVDYTCFEVLFDYVRQVNASFVINAAGFTGGWAPNGSDRARAIAVHANTVLPQTVGRVCALTNTPWGHVSSGCIYSGAKIAEKDGWQVERNLNQIEVRRRLDLHPELFHGFTEWDEPNCSFRSPPCSIYSGTKALAEELLIELGQGYIWRPNIPFDESKHPRNFLFQLGYSSKMHDRVNSLSHRDDFIGACLDLWDRQAPFGTYNIVNPGPVSTREIVKAVQRALDWHPRFEPDLNGAEFDSESAHPGSILDGAKLLQCGIRMRSGREALAAVLKKWRAQAQGEGESIFSYRVVPLAGQ